MQPCTQTDKISSLDNKTNNLMEILTEVRDDVTEVRDDIKEIKRYIFEGPMEDKFVSKNTFAITVDFMKDQLKQREKEIVELKKNQNKVAWVIISAVLVALVGMVVVPKIV